MNWINPPQQDEPDTATVVVRRPREADAVGAALAAAFQRCGPTPGDWESALRALERIN